MNKIKVRYYKLLSALIVMMFSFSTIYYAQNPSKTIDFVMQSNLFPESESKDMQISFELWVTDLFINAGLNYKVDLKLVSSEDFAENNYDVDNTYMVVISSINYLKTKNNKFLDPLLFTAEDTSQIYVIAADNRYNELDQLKDKRIALTPTGFGEISNYWLDYLITEKYNIDKDKYFSRVDSLDTESKCINSVFFNNNQACIIREEVYNLACELNPQIRSKIKIIKRSTSLLHSLFCLTGKFNEREKDKFTDAVLNVQDTERGKQILNLFKRTKLFEYKEKHLQNINNLYKNMSSLVSKK